MSFIDAFSWFVLVVLLLLTVAVVVALGAAPGRIARQRGHPWSKAVAIGGWATLLFGFVFWPLVLVWAYVDAPTRRERTP